jgi:hypothetical protein
MQTTLELSRLVWSAKTSARSFLWPLVVNVGLYAAFCSSRYS